MSTLACSTQVEATHLTCTLAVVRFVLHARSTPWPPPPNLAGALRSRPGLTAPASACFPIWLYRASRLEAAAVSHGQRRRELRNVAEVWWIFLVKLEFKISLLSSKFLFQLVVLRLQLEVRLTSLESQLKGLRLDVWTVQISVRNCKRYLCLWWTICKSE